MLREGQQIQDTYEIVNQSKAKYPATSLGFGGGGGGGVGGV